ncbi:DNA damage-regulated autophagy modulator protein 1 [Patella vulgata]|uniref:DNA damage-regulated autophagy modulator protein 1 n=1 Tax=Patella vulgata TaxID=6465 RepID=UPI00217F2C56|nr:DNA damage-regulated autophagy modulator protein 1 [Patella vulgata]XP_050408689.1 DNA damage-regulated autophagy modulator protein 1 [Patella vulgata]XP_055958027.1 DNA damage-regulated autophagy modulator protein 1 [Patella vulgata]
MVNKVCILPFLLAFFLPVTFLITYAVAVKYGHVYAAFPYISDTGSFPPESCIFGQFVNIYAVIGALFMFVRYSQIREHYRPVEELGGATPSRKRKLLANKVALVIGLLGDLGASMVGNFQEDAVIEAHVVGAFMAFGLGGIYAWMQSVLSYGISSLNGTTKCCRHIRIVLCTAYTILFILMITFTTISMRLFHKNPKKWKPDDPGYDEHLVATITEWLMVVALSLFFATFYKEFKQIGVKAKVIQKNQVGMNESV